MRSTSPGFHLRAKGLWSEKPVRVSRTAARERLPSCREPASFHLQAGCAMDRLGNMRFRAPIRRLSTRALRQAVLRASSWLAPSRSTRPCDLPMRKDARCVQPTSAIRTIDVHPLAVRSRFSRVTFATRETPRRSVVVTWHDRGPGRFHDAQDRFGLVTSNAILVPSSLRLPVTSVGLFDPRRPMG